MLAAIIYPIPTVKSLLTGFPQPRSLLNFRALFILTRLTHCRPAMHSSYLGSGKRRDLGGTRNGGTSEIEPVSRTRQRSSS